VFHTKSCGTTLKTSAHTDMSVETILDVMDSFSRIKPLGVKSGNQFFLSSCGHAYQHCCCAEGTVLSLLYNSELQVSDVARLKQLKEHQKAELSNPFNAKKLKEKKKESKKDEKELQKWHPEIPVFVLAHVSSAASLALQKDKIRRLPPPPADATDGFQASFS
jgi:hypothetical protein